MMQYFKPAEDRFFVGDCMPFYDGGRFHLYYLLDEGHHNHPVVGYMGGHQWAHASSGDLKNWTQHPIALPLETEKGDGSICTGSLLAVPKENTVYAFYALRPLPQGGEYFCIAQSRDGGVSFEKPEKPLFGPPEGYGASFRDPFVFRDEHGVYQMFITTNSKDRPFGSAGCIGHFSSRDLKNWSPITPVLFSNGDPECPDYFEWNGWHYLIFGLAGSTFYRIARSIEGPWECPAQDLLGCPLVRVMKSAAWKNSRRLIVGWLPSRDEQKARLFGGKLVFRELIQRQDGTLATGFVPEMDFECSERYTITPKNATPTANFANDSLHFNAKNDIEAVEFEGLPQNFKLTAVVMQKGKAAKALRFHFNQWERQLEILPASGKIVFDRGDNSIDQVTELLKPEFRIELVAHDEILDLCVDGARTIIGNLPRGKGGLLSISAEYGELSLEQFQLHPID
ncbi:MAG: hypothetical protein A2X49_06410 [Lentisphaerae bacterium GWF2_52_8]|nr:MAG: hypothetical protein A2X49_06410 [Lentisphaerae bacterium GWF2_52_8]